MTHLGSASQTELEFSTLSAFSPVYGEQAHLGDLAA